MQARAGRVRTLVILGEPRVAHHEFSGLAVGDLRAVRADQPDLLARDGGATRPGLAQLILWPEHHIDTGLGGAVELPHHSTKCSLGAHLQRMRAGRGAEDERP